MRWILFLVMVFVVAYLLVRRIYEKGGGKSDEGSSGQVGDASGGGDALADE